MARALGRAARRSVPALCVLALAGALTGGGVLAHHWITTSPRFGLDEIELTGNRLRSEEAIRARLDLELGDNLFRLDLTALEAELLRDPWIAEARIARRLPDELRIEVEEHEAAVLVDLGGLYLADESGEVFKRASTRLGEGRGLLTITGISRESYNRDPEAAAARIRRALEVARIWAEGEGRPALGEIRLDRRRGITLYTYEEAIAVRLGRGEPKAIAGRLAAFDSAWASLTPSERRAARFIHIGRGESPDRATVALRDEHPWEK